MKQLLSFLIILITLSICNGQNKTRDIFPVSSIKPSEGHKKMIERKYGMFIHFGINTFQDQEWTDGTKPVSSYKPTSIDAEQWIKTAKMAGMKYVILITKHHDGFCLWDSKYTEYDVAKSGNTTNVIEEVAKACKKHNIGLGLYYSLWDRNFNGNDYPNGDKHPHVYGENPELDNSYNAYMIKQLDELLDITGKYTHVIEFWFDGGWTKANNRWPLQEMYNTIKLREPMCQIGINWSIGLPENPDYHAVYPNDQKEGYPIRYFPSDFRLGDPMLPADNDPKIFTHDGKKYYMPWESTVCISSKWFYNTKDHSFKTVEELVKLYNKATAQNNILILNCPPGRDGKIRKEEIKILKQLRKELKL